MSFGAILAFLVLVAAFVMAITGKMDIVEATMFGFLALSILLSPFPVKWGAPA